MEDAKKEDECPYELWDEKTVFEGRWIRTKEVKFRTKDGEEGVWQSSHRVTRPKGSEVDGVDIIAILNKAGKKYFVLVKQYRIPVGGFCLQFPAGLIDGSETVEEAAIREMKEETGYTISRILHKTRGRQGLDVGMSDVSLQFLTAEIDGDAPENQNPQQILDGHESIEVILVECSTIMEYLRSVEQTLTIESMVYSLAIGYENMDEAKKAEHECPYELSDEKTVFEGRWIKTKEVKFRTKTGEEGVWQSSHRVTKPKGCEVDGVDIIATLNKAGKKYFVFIKQYRIPMGGWCLEFPAGLIDANETVEEAAIREMKEETGYTVTRVVHMTRGVQGLDVGLTDDSVQFVTVEIDGDAPVNQNPQQKLDLHETIDVVLVECTKVLEYLRSVEKTLHIEAMLYSFAIGYGMSHQFKGG